MINCYDEKIYAFWSGIIGIAIFAVPFLLLIFLAVIISIADGFRKLFKREDKNEI